MKKENPMSTAAVALRAAIHDALVADGALVALLGGPKVYDEPPQGAAFPYVTLGDARIADFSAGSDPAQDFGFGNGGLIALDYFSSNDFATGLAIDRKHQRLFAACSNKVMVIVDSTTGHGVAQVPIGAGVDGAAFDEAKQLAFASGGDGTLTVIREEAPDKFSVAETVATRPGARTMALDERTHRIFLSTAQRNPVAPATPGQPHPRATVVPGTFEVLVVEP